MNTVLEFPGPAWENLDAEEREVELLRRYGAGKSWEDLAAWAGVDGGAVSRMIHRAQERVAYRNAQRVFAEKQERIRVMQAELAKIGEWITQIQEGTAPEDLADEIAEYFPLQEVQADDELRAHEAKNAELVRRREAGESLEELAEWLGGGIKPRSVSKRISRVRQLRAKQASRDSGSAAEVVDLSGGRS